MMIAISLPLIAAYSLVVSGALVWLRKSGVAAIPSAVITLAICLAIGAVQVLAARSAPLSKLVFSVWGLSVLAPSAVVFAVSRLNLVRARPWSLLLLGPVSFVVGMVVAMTVYNILFVSGRQQ